MEPVFERQLRRSRATFEPEQMARLREMIGPTFRGRFVTKRPMMEAITILLARYLALVQRLRNKSLWGPVGVGIEVNAPPNG